MDEFRVLPDLVFRCTREGIPIIPSEYQALGVSVPLVPLNHRSRSKYRAHGHQGITRHGYLDDEILFQFIRAGLPKLKDETCVLVEPNLSIAEYTNVAIATYLIYLKRYISVYAGMLGCGIVIDCNIPKNFLELNLRGVPKDWIPFSTRNYAGYEFQVCELLTYLKLNFTKPKLFVFSTSNKLEELLGDDESVVIIPIDFKSLQAYKKDV